MILYFFWCLKRSIFCPMKAFSRINLDLDRRLKKINFLRHSLKVIEHVIVRSSA